MNGLVPLFRRHWFLWVAADATALTLVTVAWLDRGLAFAGQEALLIALFVAIIPLCYLLCYGTQISLVHAVTRVLALMCFGFFLLAWIIPVDQQTMLPSLTSIKYIALGALVAIEAFVAFKILKLVLRKGPSLAPQDLRDETGVPLLIARLIAAESRFWSAVWRSLRQWMQRRRDRK